MIAPAIRRFPHGVHPHGQKHIAENMAIEVLPTPKELRLCTQQHLGAPAKPTVKPRVEVTAGQQLAEAGGFVSAPVHAPYAGKTAAMAVATLPNGRHVEAIPLKVDAQAEHLAGHALYDAIYGGEWPTEGFDQDPDAIAQAALDAGLAGLGGAAFPTHVKLRRNDAKPIDVLLLNGAECEPYLTANQRLMMQAPEPIVTGALLAQRALNAKLVRIGIEDNKPAAIEAIRKAAAGTGIEVVALPTRYPQGGEKQLIYAMAGRAVHLGALPLDVGVVVLNVATSAALARAVLRGEPLTHNVVTVTGHGITTPKNILAPIGTAYAELVDFCGGLTDQAACVVAGGPMMGFTMQNLTAPITKGTSGITVLSHDEIRKATETNCVRCGRCVEVCPMNLVPTRIAMGVRAGNLDVAEQYHIGACMECGCCAYTCPASLPLVQLIRVGKVGLRNRKS